MHTKWERSHSGLQLKKVLMLCNLRPLAIALESTYRRIISATTKTTTQSYPYIFTVWHPCCPSCRCRGFWETCPAHPFPCQHWDVFSAPTMLSSCASPPAGNGSCCACRTACASWASLKGDLLGRWNIYLQLSTPPGPSASAAASGWSAASTPAPTSVATLLTALRLLSGKASPPAADAPCCACCCACASGRLADVYCAGCLGSCCARWAAQSSPACPGGGPVCCGPLRNACGHAAPQLGGC